MEKKNNRVIINIINLVLVVVAIFSCAVYSKLTKVNTEGFVFLGVGLLAYAILLFVANNTRSQLFIRVLRIIMNSALLLVLMIFAIVEITSFAARSGGFDIFEMFYALFGLIAFAFAVLNFVYCMINLKGDSQENLYSIFNWCLIFALGALTLTYVAQGAYLSFANNELFLFHGTLTLGLLIFTLVLLRTPIEKKEEKSETQPEA